jgi:phage terminase small subunit
MSQLTENQRAFVWALVETGGDETKAAILAGYGGTPGSRDVAVHRLMHNTKVLLAIKEVAEATIKGGALLGAAALVEIVRDPSHKDRLRAADMLLNRSGLIVIQEHKMVVEHRDQSVESIVARIRAMAEGMNVDPRPLLISAGVPQDIIDAEFEVVSTTGYEEDDEWTVRPV